MPGHLQPTARAAATGGFPAGVPRRLPAERLLLAAARTAHAAASTGTIAGRGPACRDLCPAGARPPADRPVVGVEPPGRQYLQPTGYAEPDPVRATGCRPGSAGNADDPHPHGGNRAAGRAEGAERTGVR